MCLRGHTFKSKSHMTRYLGGHTFKDDNIHICNSKVQPLELLQIINDGYVLNKREVCVDDTNIRLFTRVSGGIFHHHDCVCVVATITQTQKREKCVIVMGNYRSNHSVSYVYEYIVISDQVQLPQFNHKLMYINTPFFKPLFRVLIFCCNLYIFSIDKILHLNNSIV